MWHCSSYLPPPSSLPPDVVSNRPPGQRYLDAPLSPPSPGSIVGGDLRSRFRCQTHPLKGINEPKEATPRASFVRPTPTIDIYLKHTRCSHATSVVGYMPRKTP